MDANSRRDALLKTLLQAFKPMTASSLGTEFNVSRQVIVGDIALLRASGNDILATPNGYITHYQKQPQYIQQVVCQHSAEQTADELYTVVDSGGAIVDVVIDHPVYGEIKGQLNIASRNDADAFLKKIKEEETSLLSKLTEGLHTHTITTPSKEVFETIREKLDNLNIIYRD
ncbi:transcription repressor NadR [Lacticigenium naphthae]|uniref:transcription repressor NadR n=1 Tax=Lacticigenium naphthae TaxID=515351 RepID=UPI00041CDDAD|nr:transcription repressor NadR [Lacticigenium naphthae]